MTQQLHSKTNKKTPFLKTKQLKTANYPKSGFDCDGFVMCQPGSEELHSSKFPS